MGMQQERQMSPGEVYIRQKTQLDNTVNQMSITVFQIIDQLSNIENAMAENRDTVNKVRTILNSKDKSDEDKVKEALEVIAKASSSRESCSHASREVDMLSYDLYKNALLNPDKLVFARGKHEFESLQDVADNDPEYLLFIVESSGTDEVTVEIVTDFIAENPEYFDKI